jgi:hypothetical protein
MHMVVSSISEIITGILLFCCFGVSFINWVVSAACSLMFFVLPNGCTRDRLCCLVVRFPGYRSRSGFDSLLFQILWGVVGLERGTLGLLSTTEEVLERKSSGSGLEDRDYCRKDPLRWPRDTPLSAIVGTNLADKLRSLGRYSSLAE